ncbi:MAG: YceI family protein [Bacteroidia bacterium]
MKTLIISGAMLLALNISGQTKWSIDNSHTKIGFSVAHLMVSETEGKFNKYEGEVVSNADLDFTNAKIDFKVDVNSVDTDDDQRDGHLKSADFFDAEKHPQMVFKAKSMKPTKVKTNYDLVGDLTIKGITKEVKLTAVGASKLMKDPWGNTKYGFKVVGKINRKDFNLTWNKALESGGLLVGEDVNLNITLELKKG